MSVLRDWKWEKRKDNDKEKGKGENEREKNEGNNCDYYNFLVVAFLVHCVDFISINILKGMLIHLIIEILFTVTQIHNYRIAVFFI